MEIRIVRINGDCKVQPWNPPVSRDEEVVWKKDLIGVTVYFPYGTGNPREMKVDKVGKKAKTGKLTSHLNLTAKKSAARIIEYLDAVFEDGGPGKRIFVHHSHPKIVVK